jgi:excisionase family DNA binding protein
MTTADPLPHLLSIDELAGYLGTTVRHIRRLVAERRIPYLKVGRLVRFHPDDIIGWLEDARHPEPYGQSRPRSDAAQKTWRG